MIERVLVELKELFGVELEKRRYENAKQFSYLLRSAYVFFLCSGEGVRFVLMCDKGAMALTPGAIAKHVDLVVRAARVPGVFATRKMASYNRLRLLKKKVAFAIPDKQIYLPFLGVALSNTTPTRIKEFSSLGNVAQQILFAKLSGTIAPTLSIASMCDKFKYSRVSIIKAFDELEYFDLALRDPKTKRLTFPLDNKSLWGKAQPFLHNPCRRTIGVKKIPDGLRLLPAGTTALSKMSMLSEDGRLEVAVQIGDFNKLSSVERVPKEDAPVLVQLWNYKPDSVRGDSIDVFSLYLTLKENPDDRIQIALDEVVGEALA